jgi:hypothetical protein
MNNPKSNDTAYLWVRLSDRRLYAGIEPSKEIAEQPTRWQLVRSTPCGSERAARDLAYGWQVELGLGEAFPSSKGEQQQASLKYVRWISEETREKMRRAKLGVKRSDAARKALSDGHRGRKRGKFPAEWCRNISEGRRRGVAARKAAALAAVTINNEVPKHDENPTQLQ